MTRLQRTDSRNRDFADLVVRLDADPAARDGNDHLFYSQYNTIDRIKHVIVAYDINTPVGCGAMKEYEPATMEIKRMYTLPEHRGKGVAQKILSELEAWAKELSYERCVLETGKRQPEAIALYRKCGYSVIPNYGQYIGIGNSVCFEKKIA